MALFKAWRIYNASLNKSTVVKLDSMVNFTLRQLRAFLLVAQHGSFSRAATALFITPSGLSLLIRELETQLGIRLFDRTTRNVALTNSGRELLSVVQRTLQELDSATSQVGRSAIEADLYLSVGAPLFICTTVLPQVIKEFRAYRPGLRFQLFDSDAPAILEKVESGTLDMGLGLFFRHLPGVRRKALWRFSLMVIRPDIGAPSRRATTTWSALKDEKLISLQAAAPLQQLVDKQLAQAGVVQQPVLALNYIHAIIAMVEVGEGVGIVPTYALSACHGRRIVTSRLINPVVHLDFYQIRKAGRKLPPVAEEFTSFLQSYLSSWAGKSGLV
jgi:LysR family transcriptional regulator, carnitine catabolism transcriptional activator